MVKSLLVFIAGVYTGIYVTQNYEIPRVDEPQAIYDKMKEFLNKYRKE